MTVSDEYDDAGEALYTEADVRAAAELARAQASEVYRVALRVGALGGLSADVVLKALEPVQKAWDESKHKRDHGKFAKKEDGSGAGDDPGTERASDKGAKFPSGSELAQAPGRDLKAGGLVRRVSVGGREYVVKRSANKMEAVASDLAQIAGVRVPKSQLTDDGAGGRVLVQELAEGRSLDKFADHMGARAALSKVAPDEIDRHVLFDYLIGNTDVHRGNYIVSDDGALTAIDKEMILGRGNLKGQRFEPPSLLELSGREKEGMLRTFGADTVKAMAAAGYRMADHLEANNMRAEARQVRDRAVVLDKLAEQPKPTAGALYKLGSEGVTPPNLGLLGRVKWHLTKGVASEDDHSEAEGTVLPGAVREVPEPGYGVHGDGYGETADESGGWYAADEILPSGERAEALLEVPDGSDCADRVNKEWDDEDPALFSKAVADDAHTPAELLAAAVGVAQRALADGTDPEDALHALYELAHGDTVLKAWTEEQKKLHPRDKGGHFISKDAIADAKTDPAKAKELRAKVKPEDAQKLEDAIEGKTDLGRTKRGRAKHEAAQKREKVQADRNRARELRKKLSQQIVDSPTGEMNPDDLREIVPHLATMTHGELSEVRQLLDRAGATFGGKRLRADRVAALTQWALDKAAGKTDSPAPDGKQAESGSGAGESGIKTMGVPGGPPRPTLPTDPTEHAQWLAGLGGDGRARLMNEAEGWWQSLSDAEKISHLRAVGSKEKPSGSYPIGVTGHRMMLRYQKEFERGNVPLIGGVPYTASRLDESSRANWQREVDEAAKVNGLAFYGHTVETRDGKRGIVHGGTSGPGRGYVYAPDGTVHGPYSLSELKKVSPAPDTGTAAASEPHYSESASTARAHIEAAVRGAPDDATGEALAGVAMNLSERRLGRMTPGERREAMESNYADVADQLERGGNAAGAAYARRLASTGADASKPTPPGAARSAAPVGRSEPAAPAADRGAPVAGLTDHEQYPGHKPIIQKINRELAAAYHAAPPGEAKDALHRALSNAGIEDPDALPPSAPSGKVWAASDEDGMSHQRDAARELALAWEDSPDARQSIEPALRALNVVPVGDAPKGFDPSQHSSELGSGLKTGDAVEVMQPGWSYTSPRGTLLIVKPKVRRAGVQSADATKPDTGSAAAQPAPTGTNAAAAQGKPPAPGADDRAARDQAWRAPAPDGKSEAESGSAAGGKVELSKDDRKELAKYVDEESDHFAKVNGHLRGGPVKLGFEGVTRELKPKEKKDAQKTHEALQRAFASEPPTTAPETYRGMVMDRDAAERLLTRWDGAAQSGEPLTLPGYTATSFDRRTAADQFTDPGDLPLDRAAGVVMTVRNPSGLDMGRLAGGKTQDREKELLLDHNSRFRVLSVKRGEGGKPAEVVVEHLHGEQAPKPDTGSAAAQPAPTGTNAAPAAAQGKPPKTRLQAQGERARAANPPPDPNQEFGTAREQYQAFLRYAHPDDPAQKPDPGAVAEYLSKLPATAREKLDQHFAGHGKSLAQVEAYHRARMAEATPEPTPRATTEQPTGGGTVAGQVNGSQVPKPVPGGAPKAPDVSALKRNPKADVEYLVALQKQHAEGSPEWEALETARYNSSTVHKRDNSTLVALHGKDEQHGKRHYVLERLASAAAGSDPAGAKAATDAITAMGGTLHGAAPGATVPHDASHYDGPPGAFTGDPVRVVRQPVTYRGALVYRGQVEPVGGTAAATNIDTGARAANTTPAQPGGSATGANAGGAEPPKVPPVASGAAGDGGGFRPPPITEPKDIKVALRKRPGFIAHDVTIDGKSFGIVGAKNEDEAVARAKAEWVKVRNQERRGAPPPQTGGGMNASGGEPPKVPPAVASGAAGDGNMKAETALAGLKAAVHDHYEGTTPEQKSRGQEARHAHAVALAEAVLSGGTVTDKETAIELLGDQISRTFTHSEHTPEQKAEVNRIKGVLESAKIALGGRPNLRMLEYVDVSERPLDTAARDARAARDAAAAARFREIDEKHDR